ncbi:MAG TPA: hypothetical protein VLB51_11915 [Methylomirabilota bacterium]|nr:hypothetical protein [Methylomirabilota bacterium]
MKHRSWLYWVVASIAVILAGAALVAAEERIEVRVENDGGNEVTVDINGIAEVLRLEDLADGETRTFDVGDHTLVVARAGDHLTVTSEGGPLGAVGEAHDAMVWVEGDGKPGVRKRVVVVRDGDGESRYTVELDGDEVDLEGELDVEVERIVGDGAHAVFIARDGATRAPVILGAGARPGMVRYRCEATGSELLIPEADALQESYICPATSCVMTRVEEPAVEVITVRKKRVETGDE